MALTRARIQMRRGLYADFNPSKMTAGEWAVTIDADTEMQVVYMCFSPGIVKRMGTLEDFAEQIREATDDIRLEYELSFNLIKKEIEEAKNSVDSSKTYISGFEKELREIIFPEIQECAKKAEDNAKIAERWAVGREDVPESVADNSKYYAEQAKKYTTSFKEEVEDFEYRISKLEINITDIDGGRP